MRRIIPLVMCFFLMGCAGRVITNAVVQKNAPVAVQKPQPLVMNTVQWQVLTLDQMKTLIAKLEKSNQNTILFTLDTRDYNNLMLNLTDIQRYIEEQHAVLTTLQTIIAQRSGQSQPNTTQQKTKHNKPAS